MRLWLSLGIAVTLALAGCASGNSPGATVAGGPPINISFACPAPGTRTLTRMASGTTTLTWTGTDVNDPAVCLATRYNGTTQRLLYGYSLLPLDNEDDARSAFAAAFAGAPTETCFNFASRSFGATSTNPTNLYRRCIRQLGPSKVANGSTVVFAMTERGMANNAFQGTWTMVYDPVRHLFMQAELNVENGTSGGGWRRTVLAGR